MKRWHYALGAIAWMALIFLLSSQPGERLGPDSVPLDVLKKIGHCVEFGVLAILYLYALKEERPVQETGAIFILSLLLAVLFAISDEYHQSFTPGRHASAVDVLIDSCGAMLFLGYLYRRQTERIRRG